MKKIIFDENSKFYCDEETYPGVKKVAEQVRKDIFMVTDCYPEEYVQNTICENLVIYGNIGRSRTLEMLAENGKIDLTMITGKWETYLFQVISNPWEGVSQALVIAGSDKRGTIYGLYHLAELLGVSPLVNWSHVPVQKRKNACITEESNYISKEPSVKYRGFFINDEWPAFGTWAQKHFGGINALCYERVFELLLRLKGNYLWPAMWASNFSMDGPGLSAAELADELGVVMSTSHHEPCMRSGEEFGLLNKTNPEYGTAWNFRTNREGVTKFWRDGLLRNGKFENVITMGMRGERDTAILGKEATLQDNIDLLRDVLKTQNRLIRETVCEDLDKVPRQIVLFTEVEEFFYGNETTKGIKDDPELEGVTLMLSDNNFGYTRTLPTKEMRKHKGGYGMYYHMDMHGGAHSYQWIGSTYLPRVWEQMTQAYEFGVQEIWVTNVGDIGTQEFGLSFFLDLAYDMEKWGGCDAVVTEEYTKKWVEQNFKSSFSMKDREKICELLWDYTGLLAKRKHEIMNAEIYHPVHFGEAEEVLQVSERMLRECERLKNVCEEKDMSAYISLAHYPVCGTANLMKMWILAGRNELYAKQNKVEANLLAEQIGECMQKDEELVAEYQSVDGGYYDGFGESEHIGFTNWNDEDNKYPIRHLVFPAKAPRMLFSKVDDTRYMTGLPWTDCIQVWSDGLRPDVDTIEFDLSCGSEASFSYRITTDCEWIEFSSTEGTVDVRERVELKIHREKLSGREEGVFQVENIGMGKATVKVLAENYTVPKGVFLERDGYICMHAEHFYEKQDCATGAFQVLKPYGRTGSAVKVYPVTADFLCEQERPFVEYRFIAAEAGAYRLVFQMAPTTPVVFEREQYIGYVLNGGPVQIVNTVEMPEIPFFLSGQWAKEAKSNCKEVEVKVECLEGENTLRFFGMSPGIVLEKMYLFREENELSKSYLGPKESYRGPIPTKLVACV